MQTSHKFVIPTKERTDNIEKTMKSRSLLKLFLGDSKNKIAVCKYKKKHTDSSFYKFKFIFMIDLSSPYIVYFSVNKRFPR